ncbi:MAG: aminoacetone oxidase family FAD-binding enzyme, partial [Candidatus Eisenbacteria bacterium]|nr:aminoacetone oxidase family FAD-binding enzyme [Candidatus Latescibacterota bacterium]MBD3302788.1 aminoacetone oxidase family FAD-binding enzyme [Candidatus Eisenbacteria bacterium]
MGRSDRTHDRDPTRFLPPGSGAGYPPLVEANRDLVVVGAGAAGLAAGIFAAEEAARCGLEVRIQLLDGARKLGAKILVSGGGRCNVTHSDVKPADFHGDPRFVARVLAALDEAATASWFADLGVALKREPTGKLFPVSDRARTVRDALLGRCRRLGVAIRTDWRVEGVSVSPGGGFRLHGPRGAIEATRIVLATGGRSLPRSGSDGHGLEIARSLGHRVVPPVPALVPLRLGEGAPHRSLQGITQPATVTVRGEDGTIGAARGGLLWTHFGVSGPAVLDASRHWTCARRAGRAARVEVDLLPDDRPEEA